MSTRLDARVNEGSTVGFKIRLYDVNSAVVIPSSVDWYLYDSFNTVISTGAASAISSETLITIGSSLTMISSLETRPDPKRYLYIDATYTDAELGPGSIEKEVFEFTICNNPWIP